MPVTTFGRAADGSSRMFFVSLRSVRAVTANPPLRCLLGSGPDRSACCRSSGGRIASAPPAGDQRRVLIGCVVPGEMPGFDDVDHSCTSVWAGRCAATIGLVLHLGAAAPTPGPGISPPCRLEPARPHQEHAGQRHKVQLSVGRSPVGSKAGHFIGPEAGPA